MRVLQLGKRSVITQAVVALGVIGCGDSGPDVPFDPAGTTADLEAVGATFESPTFASFSSFSLLFDAALGGTPMVPASAAAIDVRGKAPAGLRALAARSASKLAGLMRTRADRNFSASVTAIPADLNGKTFVYDGGSYVPSDLPGAPDKGVRFLLYAVNPASFEPIEPLDPIGYVDLIDRSGSSTEAAQVVVVSGSTTYLDYTVTATGTATGAKLTVTGFVTDGVNRANVNLRSTLTSDGDLSLIYSLDVPERDVSIDLTLNASGLDQQGGTMDIELDLRGPNGVVAMSGQFSETGGTLAVRVGGDLFATINSAGGAGPVITGADGNPLSDADVEALGRIFSLTGEAFALFDGMVGPVGAFLDSGA